MHADPPPAGATTAAKLPAVTLGFWITKILATTVGETAGDAASMSLGFGYLASTVAFFVAFLAALALQISTRRFRPGAYWLAVIASTTVGTTLADFADRSLGIGYPGGATLLLGLTLGSLFAWHRALGSIDITTVVDARSEAWYWITIMFSQTLGTALGDWTADSVGLGYGGAALLFAGLLTLVALALAFTRVSHTALFWTAFILTRPLGAVVGDFLDKPVAEGGLALSRYAATGVLFAAIAALVLLIPQRAAASPRCRAPCRRRTPDAP